MVSQDDGLKVIGAGLPKTATNSLQIAFQRLGLGPCHHMYQLLYGKNAYGRSQEFLRAYNGEKVDFRALFDGYQSTVDIPGCDFYRELMQVYPEAKVILSVRDPKAWSKSCRDTFVSWNSGPWYTRPVWFGALPHMAIQRKVMQAVLRRLGVDTSRSDITVDPEYHDRWVQQVKKDVPADRLLVWHVKDGYKPICEFLNLPIPDEPFPRVNDTLSMRAKQRSVAMTCHLVTGIIATSAALSAVTLFKVAVLGARSWNQIKPTIVPGAICAILAVTMRLHSVRTLCVLQPIFFPIAKRYLQNKKACLSVAAAALITATVYISRRIAIH